MKRLARVSSIFFLSVTILYAFQFGSARIIAPQMSTMQMSTIKMCNISYGALSNRTFPNMNIGRVTAVMDPNRNITQFRQGGSIIPQNLISSFLPLEREVNISIQRMNEVVDRLPELDNKDELFQFSGFFREVGLGQEEAELVRLRASSRLINSQDYKEKRRILRDECQKVRMEKTYNEDYTHEIWPGECLSEIIYNHYGVYNNAICNFVVQYHRAFKGKQYDRIEMPDIIHEEKKIVLPNLSKLIGDIINTEISGNEIIMGIIPSEKGKVIVQLGLSEDVKLDVSYNDFIRKTKSERELILKPVFIKIKGMESNNVVFFTPNITVPKIVNETKEFTEHETGEPVPVVSDPKALSVASDIKSIEKELGNLPLYLRNEIHHPDYSNVLSNRNFRGKLKKIVDNISEGMQIEPISVVLDFAPSPENKGALIISEQNEIVVDVSDMEALNSLNNFFSSRHAEKTDRVLRDALDFRKSPKVSGGMSVASILSNGEKDCLILSNSNGQIFLKGMSQTTNEVLDRYRKYKSIGDLEDIYEEVYRPLTQFSFADKYLIVRTIGSEIISFPLMFNLCTENKIVLNSNIDSPLANILDNVKTGLQISSTNNWVILSTLPTNESEFEKSGLKGKYKKGYKEYNEEYEIWKKVLHYAEEKGAIVIDGANLGSLEDIAKQLSSRSEENPNISFFVIGEKDINGIEKMKMRKRFLFWHWWKSYTNQDFMNIISGFKEKHNISSLSMDFFSCISRGIANEFVDNNTANVANSFPEPLDINLGAYILKRLIEMSIDNEKKDDKLNRFEIMNAIRNELIKYIKENKPLKFEGKEIESDGLMNIFDSRVERELKVIEFPSCA